jgi:hypothetical protein
VHEAAAKTALNALLRRNFLRLSFEERSYLIRTAGVGHFFVPPTALMMCAMWANRSGHSFKFNFINFAPLVEVRLEDSLTYKFISEVRSGKPYQETDLFKRFKNGKPLRRPVDRGKGRVKHTLSSDDDFKTYYDQRGA